MPVNQIPTNEFINVKTRNRLNSSITEVTPNSSPEKIDEVRRVCSAEFERTPNDFDPIDIERFLSSDWTITRFLLSKNDNPKDAARMIISCGRWRHRLGMPRWKDEDFPREFYNLGAIFPYTQDLLGNTVMLVRAKFFDRRLRSIQQIFSNYMVHVANKVDDKRDGRGWSVIVDYTGTGMTNVDINMFWFMVREVLPHLPIGLNYIVVYEMPWFLSKIIMTIASCIPSHYKKLIKIAYRKDIHNWVANDLLPDFMGGTCEIDYRRAPEGSRSLKDMATELKLSEKDLNAIMEIYQPYLDAANKSMVDRKSKQFTPS